MHCTPLLTRDSCCCCSNQKQCCQSDKYCFRWYWRTTKTKCIYERSKWKTYQVGYCQPYGILKLEINMFMKSGKIYTFLLHIKQLKMKAEWPLITSTLSTWTSGPILTPPFSIFSNSMTVSGMVTVCLLFDSAKLNVMHMHMHMILCIVWFYLV